MRLLVIGAMDSEIEFLKTQLQNLQLQQHNSFLFYLGSIDDKDIILVKSGIGRVMCGLLISVANCYYQFDGVINVGYAGGAKGTNLGDIIVGKNYVYGDVDLTSGGFGYEFGQMSGCPRVFKTKFKLNKLSGDDFVFGDMCTCDSFITSESFVKELNEKYFYDLNIKCFDMETTSFAQACHYYDIPFLSVRSISDVIGSNFQTEDYANNEKLSAIKVNKFVIKLIKCL